MPLQHLLASRARQKARRLAPWLADRPASSVLDLGAGEGYVGRELAAMLGARVVLADVLDFHRVNLPFVQVDEGPLPFADDAFDGVVLAYVLHHAADARALLAEALRVGRRLVVLESVFASPFEHLTLEGLDRLANRVRSHGRMTGQEAHLHFRSDAAWRALLASLGTLTHAQAFGRWPHPQALYVLDR